MVAIEKVKYVPDPNNPNETIAFKEAWVESGLYGLRYVIDEYYSSHSVFKNQVLF